MEGQESWGEGALQRAALFFLSSYRGRAWGDAPAQNPAVLIHYLVIWDAELKEQVEDGGLGTLPLKASSHMEL